MGITTDYPTQDDVSVLIDELREGLLQMLASLVRLAEVIEERIRRERASSQS